MHIQQGSSHRYICPLGCQSASSILFTVYTNVFNTEFDISSKFCKSSGIDSFIIAPLIFSFSFIQLSKRVSKVAFCIFALQTRSESIKLSLM